MKPCKLSGYLPYQLVQDFFHQQNQSPRKTIHHQILGTCFCEQPAAQSKYKDSSSTLGSHLHRPNSKLDSSSNSTALQNNLCCSYICQKKYCCFFWAPKKSVQHTTLMQTLETRGVEKNTNEVLISCNTLQYCFIWPCNWFPCHGPSLWEITTGEAFAPWILRRPNSSTLNTGGARLLRSHMSKLNQSNQMQKKYLSK